MSCVFCSHEKKVLQRFSKSSSRSVCQSCDSVFDLRHISLPQSTRYLSRSSFASLLALLLWCHKGHRWLFQVCDLPHSLMFVPPSRFSGNHWTVRQHFHQKAKSRDGHSIQFKYGYLWINMSSIGLTTVLSKCRKYRFQMYLSGMKICFFLLRLLKQYIYIQNCSPSKIWFRFCFKLKYTTLYFKLLCLKQQHQY